MIVPVSDHLSSPVKTSDNFINIGGVHDQRRWVLGIIVQIKQNIHDAGQVRQSSAMQRYSSRKS